MRAARGYAIVVALLLVAFVGLAASLAVLSSSQEAQRQRELELLFVGDQFREALRAYAAANPGTPEYPRRLADLLEDHRVPTTRRFLRRIYPDPMTGRPDWALIWQGDRIVGIHSTSTRTPQRHANFSQADYSFADASSYADWRFTVAPSSGTTPSLPGASSGNERAFPSDTPLPASAVPPMNGAQEVAGSAPGAVPPLAPQRLPPAFSSSTNGFAAGTFTTPSNAESSFAAP